ncbi:MAG: ATP synthase subunit I [Gallionella sp.]|nr:ATP synthase subunit I [Gallionella sp.]
MAENARAFCCPWPTSDDQGHMMDKVTNTKISRAFNKAARWQIIITVFISCVSLLVAGTNAAISAIAGGASVIVGGFAGMMMARRPNGGTPDAVMFSLLKAEVIKVLVIAVLLLVTFRYYRGLVPLFLIGGLAGAVLASGAGLLTVNNENDE